MIQEGSHQAKLTALLQCQFEHSLGLLLLTQIGVGNGHQQQGIDLHLPSGNSLGKGSHSIELCQ
ncbi:hypothetical protein D9M73_292420 [compost metagenome]